MVNPLFARTPKASERITAIHPNAIRHNVRMATQPGNSRDTGMVAIYAIGCLAVVVVLVVGLCCT